MLKKLTPFEKNFLTSNFFIFCVDFIFLNIFNFYIWEKTNSLNMVFIFNIIQALFIIFATLLSEFLLERISPRILRILAITFFIPFAIVTLLSDEPSTWVIVVNGMLLGINYGFRSQAYFLLYRSAVIAENRSLFESLQTQASNIRLIILPLILSFIVSFTKSYVPIFVLGVLFIILSIIPLLLLKTSEFEKSTFSFKGILQSLKDKNEINKLVRLKFLEGINMTFQFSVLSIITLKILGNIGNWGIFSTLSLIIQIIIAQIIGSKLKLKSSPAIIGIISFLYIIGALVLANYFNFYGILFFTLLTIPFNSLHTSSSAILREKEIDFNLIKNEYSDEIYAILEIARSFGKIFPLVILLLFKPDFENDIVLRITVLVFGIAAFIIFTESSKMNVIKRNNDPFFTAD